MFANSCIHLCKCAAHTYQGKNCNIIIKIVMILKRQIIYHATLQLFSALTTDSKVDQQIKLQIGYFPVMKDIY